MKNRLLALLVLLGFLLLGSVCRTPPREVESATYIPPPTASPEPASEPERTHRPNHENFCSSLDERLEVEGERPWFYDESLSREENILSYLMEKAGLNTAAACGVWANIHVETGGTFDPMASNGSYGLCQWLGGRLSNLKTWCAENGEDYRTIEGQLAFLVWELQYDDPYGTWAELTSAEDSADGAYRAGWYFCYWFERPLELNSQSNYRAWLAAEHYRELA